MEFVVRFTPMRASPPGMEYVHWLTVIVSQARCTSLCECASVYCISVRVRSGVSETGSRNAFSLAVPAALLQISVLLACDEPTWNTVECTPPADICIVCLR